MNHFTETSSSSYGANIKSSFKGIVFGLFLILASIILLSYNENRSINQTLALEEMQSKLFVVNGTMYDIQYERKPTLIQGEVSPINDLEDSEFGLSSDGLVLERHVSMYQWQERKSSKSEDKLGGGTETVTTYDYAQAWVDHKVDSSTFKHPENHQNPSMSHTQRTFSTDANIGDFYLSKTIISQFESRQPFDGLSSLPKEIAGFSNHKSFLYRGENPNSPKIGDLKITYTHTPKGIYSIVGMTENKSIVPYVSQNDRTLLFIRSGMVSADTIFKEEFSSNSTLTWILRGVGLVLMFIGFMLIMAPLSTFANVIPMVGSLIEGASALVAGILTLLLGSVVIAIAWFASRPMLSLVIIAVGVGIPLILGEFKNSSKKPLSPPNRNVPPQRSGATPPPRR